MAFTNPFTDKKPNNKPNTSNQMGPGGPGADTYSPTQNQPTVTYSSNNNSGVSQGDNKGAYIASTQGGTNTQGTPPAVDPQGGDGNPVQSQLNYIISQKDKLKLLPHSTNPELNKYQEIMNNFRLSNPDAYKKKFPFSAGLMNLLPAIMKKVIPGAGIIEGIGSALNTAKNAPVVKEGIQMLTDLVYDPTVNLYNTVAAGTPGKTETNRIFTPGNLPGVSPHYDAPNPLSDPMVKLPSSSPTEAVTETDLSELVFDPTTEDQIRAMQMFGGTGVGSTEGMGSGPVLTQKGANIAAESGIDGAINQIDPLVDFTQEDLVNLSGAGEDVDESVITEETEKGTPDGMTPGVEAEAAVDNTIQDFINSGMYQGSLLNSDIVTNTDENFDTGVYNPAYQQYLNTLNSLPKKAQGGIASFANGGYNYINGNTMNNESLTASANIDDRIMKNLQYEKMAPGMMGYKNGGLTSLNNSDYNKLKSTYQYMGDF